MKRILLIALALTTIMIADAQPTWTIRFNNKVILTVKTENEVKNVVKIKKADLDKNSSFMISYIKTLADSVWNRRLMISDSAGNNITENMDAINYKNVPGISYPIPNSTLKSLLTKYRKIKIYTVAIPSDPAKAAAVRVRRVHICTIESK